MYALNLNALGVPDNNCHSWVTDTAGLYAQNTQKVVALVDKHITGPLQHRLKSTNSIPSLVFEC